MTRITGQQARELLEGTTPGPWEAGPSMTLSTTVAVFSHGHGPVAFVSNREGGVDEVPALTDGALAAAAPDLAETVAWLYRREPDGHKHTWEDIPAWRITGDSDYMEDDVDVWVPRYGGRITVDRIEGNLTPKQAVELARALLAAAEESRNV